MDQLEELEEAEQVVNEHLRGLDEAVEVGLVGKLRWFDGANDGACDVTHDVTLLPG